MHAYTPAIRTRHRRQWLVLMLAWVLLALLLATWLVGQRQQLLDDNGHRLRAQVQAVERILSRQLWGTHQILQQLVSDWQRWPPAQRVALAEARLRALAGLQIGVRTLSVLDAQGRVLASNRPELVGRDFSAREYFTRARAANDAQLMVLSPPFRTVLGVFAMNAVLVLQDGQGGFQGVVAATLDPNYFELLLSSVNFAPDMWSSVAHGSGVLAVLRPEQPGLEGRNLNVPGSLFARHLALGQDQSYFRDTMALTGERRLMAHGTVRIPDTELDHTLVVAVSRSEAAVLAQWVRLAGGAAGMNTLLLAFAGLALFWMQRAERQSAADLDRLERIGETAPGVICQFELRPDGRAALPYATRSLQGYFGVPTSSEPGSADPLFSFIDPAQAQQVQHAILASAQALKPLHEEFLIRVPGEPERWLDVHMLPARRADGSTLWTGLVRDATELRRAREAQRALEAAQAASQAKSEFLSRASHELRTPLNAVIGFSSLLLSHARDPLAPVQREQLGYIHDAGQHLLALIDDLLDVSAVESGRVQAVISDVPVAQLISEVMSTVREQASAAGVHLLTRLQAERVVARADRLRLKQVLLNLLSNAIKYNHRGGEVTVALTGMPGQTVEITVHDTGVGLSDEQRAHLFEPFNRLGAEQRGIAGTGIGLTITRMLVERMNGRIRVESAPGRGSSFLVQLQASTALADDAAAPCPQVLVAPPAPAPDGARLLVLYAEDNAMNALFVEQLLALRPNMRLIVATSGEQAIQLARSLRPGLVMVDLHLGDMSGFDLLAALRASPETANTRCVALTADALPATAERALAAGFSDFITKPVDVHRLLRLVDEAAATAPG
jgi:signal transduction histidine kinase